MLVLTRRSGESIVIDGNVRIQIVSINGNKVRLGIDAPDEVRVDREEIHQRRSTERTQRTTPVAATNQRFAGIGHDYPAVQ